MFAYIKQYFHIILTSVISVAFVASVGGSFYLGRHLKSLEDTAALDKQRVSMQAQIDAERDRREEVSTKFETKLDNMKIVNTTINRTVQTELQKQVYVDCSVPSTGIILINDSADKLNKVRNSSITSNK